MEGSNATTLLRTAFLFFLPEKCYDEYFINFNFLDVPCFKSALSKGLGLAVTAGSVVVKVPQISKIWVNQSAQGVSFMSVLMDLFAITATTSYSFVRAFPFSAYGEGGFLAVQTLVIAALVLRFNVSHSAAYSFTVAYISLFVTLVSGFTPIKVLWALQAASVPIVVLGKLLQAHSNYKNQGTGQLSVTTCTMLFFGSLSRVFTSVQETGDPIIILTYSAASFCNAIIVSQFVYYSGTQVDKKEAHKKKE